MIKAGKYTAALLLIAVGTALLIDISFDTDYVDNLMYWWPVILIGVGIEYLVLGTLYRNPDKKMSLAVGSLILSVVLSVVVVGFIHASDFSFFKNIHIGPMSFSDESGIKYDLDTTRAPLDDHIDKVYVKNPNGFVKLQPGDVSEIQIETALYVPQSIKEQADEIAEGSQITVDETGGTLKIIAEGKEYKVFGIKQKPRMNMIVTVPRDREKDFELDLTNGKAEADGIAVDETLKADTTNGAVIIRNIDGNVIADTTNGAVTVEQVRGDVKADTTNGSITAADIEGNLSADTTNGKITAERVSGTVKTDTTNGSIDLTDVEADVTADTTNGGVTVRTQNLGGDWRLDTTHGKIELYLPDSASFDVTGESGYGGNISTDFPLHVTKGEVSGSVNGGEYRIGIDTNSGIGIYRHKNN